MSITSTRSPSTIQLPITPKSFSASHNNQDLREPLLSSSYSATQIDSGMPFSEPNICKLSQQSAYLFKTQSVKPTTLTSLPNSCPKEVEYVSAIKKPNRLKAFFTAIAMAFVALYHWIFSRSSDSQAKAIQNPVVNIYALLNTSTLELVTPSPAKGDLLEFIAGSSADLGIPVNFHEHISHFPDESL